MTFASIVGHASFHTAALSGPSMIERSYRADSRRAPAERAPASAGVAEGWVTVAASLIAGKLPVGDERGEHGAHGYLPTVNGAVALTVPHSMRSR